MLTLYRITLAPARKPYRIGLLFTHNNGDLGEISVTDGTLFFFKREAGKFSQANIVFICGSRWKQIFLCLRLPANTLFFTCIQFISVFTLSANDLSQNFHEESHLLSHILHTRCSVRVAYGFGTKSHPEWCAQASLINTRVFCCDKFSIITFWFLTRWLRNFAKNNRYHSAIIRNIPISLMVNIS